MNPGIFFVPRMVSNMTPMIRASYLPTRNFGLFGKISNALRTFNWSGLLNGANKTLNVVNQTIPLVRQAGPMINNMKSMLKIAKVFGSETTSNSANRKNNNLIASSNKYDHTENATFNNQETEKNNDISNTNYPNFFI
ncbi:MAG: hypothetical protein IJE89_00590 [Bacilli bacterium]|nr:hypothetical protein [Bacilli bacterium]